MDTLFKRLLSHLKIRHTQYANKLYNEHPYRYTMYGMKQMLSSYQVNSKAYQLSDKKELLKLETPFISEVSNDLVIVKSINEKQVVFDWYGEIITVATERFYESFSGKVLLSYPQKQSIEPNYKEHIKKMKLDITEWIIVISGLILLSTYLYIHKSSEYDILNILRGGLDLIGIYICSLIIGKSLNIENKATDRICNLFKKSSCNDILEMPIAKFLNRYGWGEIGLSYFTVNLIIILLFPNHIYEYLPIISIIVSPYIIWSIWYQKYKAKNWCSLCLIVQIILFLQVIISILDSSIQEVNLQAIVPPIMYLITVLLVHKIIDIIKEALSAKDWKAKLTLLKYQKEIIDKLFESQELYDISTNTSKIVFGNEDANYTLTIFSNPYCNPCAKMHERISSLLNSGCKIQYIFTYFSEDLSNINRLFIAAYLKYGKEKTWNLLTEWYSGGKNQKEKFFDKELEINDKNIEEEFRHHENWKRISGFNATPTLLFNGKKLPEAYNLDDIIYIINNGI